MKSSNPVETAMQITLFENTEPSNAYKKAVQLVHSKPSSPLTLLQGKLSNCWLKNALNNEADKAGWWSIPIKEMATTVGFDSKNREYLRASSLELMKVVFEYDAISQRNHRILWKASVLFPDIEIQDSCIRYRISDQLRDRVLNPEMYALIDLNVLRRFRRATSIPIYEHCIRFVNLKKTAVVKLDLFRDIVLGDKSAEGQYKQYKYFKQRILVPTIAEINTFSEITIKLIEGFIGKKVDTIMFLVERKVSLEDSVPNSEEVAQITTDLQLFGIADSEVTKLLKQHPPSELKAALEYTRARQSTKREALDNPVAYFTMALQKGWGIVEAESVTELKQPPASKAPKGVKKTLADVYLTHQIKEAQSYFAALSGDKQDAFLKRYNDQQPTATLRFKKERQTKSSQAGFFGWLVKDKWGPPTTEQLFEFASEQLAQL